MSYHEGNSTARRFRILPQDRLLSVFANCERIEKEMTLRVLQTEQARSTPAA